VNWNRRLLLGLGLLATTLSALAAPALGADLAAAPLPSALAADAFTAGRFHVTVHAERSATAGLSVCIEAQARTQQGLDTQTLEYEGTCFDAPPSSSYRFAPLQWLASTSGPLKSTWITQSYRRAPNGDWVLVADHQQQSTARVDLRWTGRGPQRTHHMVSGGLPLSCYTFVPICTTVSVGVTRAATVQGSIAFQGISVLASVPHGHAGTMTVGE
jgi:hypothetical protein